MQEILSYIPPYLTPANSLVESFLVVMGVLALVHLSTFPSRRWHIDFKTPIVSLGILGTFVGVAMGLWEFDSQAVEESVPNLLEGLKTAFQTSIFGMAIAIALAIIERFVPQFGSDKSQSEKQTLAALLEEAKQQRTELRDSLGSVRETLDKILNALNGGIFEQISSLRTELRANADKMKELVTTEFGRANESSAELLKQFKEQRSELREDAGKSRELIGGEFRQTNDALGKALDKISEGASKEIIKALEESIQGFNTNLTEQFGENFKQLNAACKSLVQWQEQHRESVEATHQQLRDAVAALSQTEKSLGAVAERNQEVLVVYERLREIIAAYDNQTKALTQHLEKYAALADKAEKMFGDADERFKNITEQISGFANDFQTKIGEQSELIKGMLDASQQSFTKSVKQLGADISGVATEMGESYKSVTSNFKKSAADMQKTVNAQSQAITEITQQLAKSLTDLENTLVSVTKQMGEKYQAFLDGARHIAEMSPNAKGGRR